MTLTDRDLRLMERLARAQARKAGGADEGAVEEIKRHRTRHRLGRGAHAASPGGDGSDRHHAWGALQLVSRPVRQGYSQVDSSRAAGRACRAWRGGASMPAASACAASSSKALAVRATIGVRARPAAVSRSRMRAWRRSRPSPASGSP